MGRYSQARDKLVSLLAKEPDNPHLFYWMAQCLLHLHSFEEALVFCVEALEKGMDQEDGNFTLGQIYVQLESYVEAEQSFLTVLRLNPQNSDAFAVYGYLMLRTGHEEKARHLMDEALRLDPDNETVVYYAFYFNLAKGNKHKQLALLDSYLKVSSDDVGKFIKMGQIDYYQKNYAGARENFRQAYLLDPSDKDLLEILRELDRITNPFFKPLQLVDTLGGPGFLWVSFIVLAVIFVYLDWVIAGGILVMVYFLFVVYSWTVTAIYSVYQKIRRR
jgi:tetratricopeptide (TPR) repeat protein